MLNDEAQSFSRIPVYENDKDNVIGVVLKDDILNMIAGENAHLLVKDILLKINTVKSDMPLPELFRFLARSKQHLSIVKDEFGTLVGLVSLEDVFETLLGHEIVDESDKVIDLQEYARQKFGDDNS